MRVTLLGNFNIHHFAHHWRGLKMGFFELQEKGQVSALQFIDWRSSTMSKSMEPGHHPIVNQAGWERTRDTIKAFGPDVIIFCTGDSLNNQTLELADQCGAFTCLWFCDIREPEPLPFERLGLLAMTSGGELLKETATAWGLDPDKQAIWLTQACLPMGRDDFMAASYNGRWLHDIVFVGSAGHPQYHTERKAIINELGQKYGRVGKFKWIDPTADVEKEMVTEKLPQIYQGSKIAWGHSDGSTYGYHSNRIHLAIGNGGFYLCNDFPGIEEMYFPGEHCATYFGTSPSDSLVAHVEFWLNNDDDREHIRLAGWEHAQEHHTYPLRCRQLWSAITMRM